MKYLIYAVILIIILYILFAFFYTYKKKIEAKKYVEKHPEVAKILLKTKMAGVTTYISNYAFTILSVNGKAPHFFFEKKERGLFLLPGENIIELRYTASLSKGILRTVAEIVGPCKYVVTAEAEKNYIFSFNPDEEEKFNFERADGDN